jgi:60S ribosomal subunit assembly/export protein LOC1
MAPTKSSKSAPSKGPSKGGASKGGKSASKSGDRPRPKKPTGPKPKTVEQKTKSTTHGPAKKKKRVYTEKELNIPTLNAIRPAGIQKPNGVKKGKTFVDDKESLMTILAMVQAEKEGNIESKMIRARQMEVIREARKAEADKREAGRKEKLVRTSQTYKFQTPSAHIITGGSQG